MLLWLLAGCLVAADDDDDSGQVDDDDSAATDDDDSAATDDDDSGEVDDDDSAAADDDDDTPEARRCNGHAALCDRPFDEVALAATHNSMSNGDEGWLAPNQQHSIEQQLDDGIRGLLLDTHYDNGVPTLCHSWCGLGSRPLVDALQGIGAFLDANPDEVVAIIFQDGISAEDTEQSFIDAGIDGLVYTHGGAFPTLAEMLDADERIVVGAEFTGPPPAWYHHAWDLWFDTPYSFDSLSAFNCDLNRGSESNPLFLMNHWISNPLSTEANAIEANAWDVLWPRADDCWTARGHIPNLVAVDHYAVGDLFAVVDDLNGVP